MINELLEEVIKKHGYISIHRLTGKNSNRGNFRIGYGLIEDLGTSELPLKREFNIDCFELETGLVRLLSLDKKNE